MRFVGTGTELSVRVDPQTSRLGEGDFEAGRGRIEIVGELTLNYNRVRCIAELDLATLEGTGRVEFLNVVGSAAG